MSHDDNRQQADELLARARRMQERPVAPVSGSRPFYAPVTDGVKAVGNKIGGAYQGLKDRWWAARYPLWIAERPFVYGLGLIKYGAKAYGWLWNKTVYKKDKETGKPQFKKVRAAFMSSATLVVAYGMTSLPLAEDVRYFVHEPVADAFKMATMYRKDEKLYLSNSQEIFPEKNIHQVRGCKTKDCDESDSVYFYVEPRLSHNVWNLAVHGNPFFIPDHVVGPIAPGINECSVTSYGFRWRFTKRMQDYPEMLYARCTNIGFNLKP